MKENSNKRKKAVKAGIHPFKPQNSKHIIEICVEEICVCILSAFLPLFLPSTCRHQIMHNLSCD